MAFVLEFSESVQRLRSTDAAPLAETPVGRDWATLARAVDEALGRGETHYTDRPGILSLREKVAAMLLTRFGVTADAKTGAMITCGVVEARFVAMQQLVAAGDAVWSPESLSDRIAGAALIRRAEVAGHAKAAKLVYLASSLGEDRLREMLQTLPSDALVLYEVDESSSHFHPAQAPNFAERTITIGSLGYASWQTGYLLAPDRLSAGLRDFKQALTICSTNLSQWAALAAMEAQ